MSFLKNTAKKAVGFLFRCLSFKRSILFESTPDFSDNTYPVFLALQQMGVGEKYHLVWSCAKEQPLPNAPKGIRYIYPQSSSKWQKLRNAYYRANAKCMICCNRHLYPWGKGQMTIYLSHGTPLKNSREYYSLSAEIDYCLAASEGVADMLAYQLSFPRERVIPLGFPRNDVLTQPQQPVKQMLETDCRKVIVWYPTFRQHKNGMVSGSDKALPVIHDAAAAQELNEWAREQDVQLVLKPHFAQDLTKIKALNLSNIRFIGDAFFPDHNTTSYAFVAGCDALITDYSSIYYDYLLCDKPIGLIWEDLEEYRSNPGFAVDIEEIAKSSVVIYTLADFKEFIRQIARGEDNNREERNAMCRQVNYSRDGKNAQRVADFIIEKAKL